jgi:hypothetical protein
MNEEVIEFSPDQITGTAVLGAIGADKKWPKKDGSTKDVRVIKSFVVEVAVGLTFDEIAKQRAEQVASVNEALKSNPTNLALVQKVKDFGEMTVMSCIDLAQVPGLLSGKIDGTEAELNFDGRERKFVAEHGEVLDIVSHMRSPALVAAASASSALAGAAASRFTYV